ncbi:MAG: hypothetical protein ACRYFU_04520 [Janthinobacterium lividum]
MKSLRALAITGIVGLTVLEGCSSVRRVTRVQTVGTSQTVSVEQVQKDIAERDAAVQTLNASVLIAASTGGSKEGQVKTYTSFRGYIFVRKPRELRVILQVPFVGSRALDMVSDGKTFTLLIPPRNRAIVGTNELTKVSKNGLENIRPAVFLDSLLLPAAAANEFVAMTETMHVIEPAHGRKAEIDEPEYDLTVFRVAGGQVLRARRVVHISRVTLLPFQQDIYDDQGEVVTQTTYANYVPAGGQQFPRLITITRPLDEYSLRVEITKLTLNEQFPNDQFELRVPPDVKVERMD